MKPQLSSPSDLATILEVDSNSSDLDKEKEGWIMSVSKTFCAATAALMAADGKFGEKKMNATLLDILNEAEKRHPHKIEKIEEYRKLIAQRKFGNITMSQLLSHRSGLTQGDRYFDPNHLSQIELYNDPELLAFDSGKQGAVFSYCNSGFTLAEDMMSFASDFEEGYYAELKNRITAPLGLSHTKSVYESEQSRETASEIVKIEGVVYDWGVESKESVRTDPLKNTQKGYIALSEGGLCSSVSDLEKFYAELSKLACGMPNELVLDPKKTQEIHGFYLDAYQAGEHCKSDSARDLSIHCAGHYSLGVIIEAVDENDKVISSRGNEDIARIRFQHIGNHPGNDAAVSATMPFSFSTFTQSRGADLLKVDTQLSASISQKDVLAKDSLLTIVSCDYIAAMDEYFCGKCDKLTDKTYNDEWRAYNQYWEAARTGDYVAKAWQKDLIAQHRLPKNFGEFHDAIRAAYEPAQEALIAYVKENFCDESGVIDSKKVKSKLQTVKDFEKVKEAIMPALEAAKQQTRDIFARCDDKLKYDQNLVKFDSWVDKLGLEKSADQDKSFVERMQSETKGKSLSGSNEL